MKKSKPDHQALASLKWTQLRGDFSNDLSITQERTHIVPFSTPNDLWGFEESSILEIPTSTSCQGNSDMALVYFGLLWAGLRKHEVCHNISYDLNPKQQTLKATKRCGAQTDAEIPTPLLESLFWSSAPRGK